jgi:acyl-coenzyme A thioesterase PaaI-like protein
MDPELAPEQPTAKATAPEPRVWSPRRGRWLLNLYPPFLFQRIRVAEIGAEYRYARLVVKRSLLNRNLNGTIFGGSISSAADPMHAILFWQALARRGLATHAWTRSARVEFEKPGDCDLTLEFAIEDDVLRAAERAVRAGQSFVRTFPIEVLGHDGVRRARVETEIHLRPVRSKASAP